MRELLERLKRLIRENADAVKSAADTRELVEAASTLTYMEEQVLCNEKTAAEQTVPVNTQASLGSIVADQAKGG